jgi:H+/Cl- antiporter ClcA
MAASSTASGREHEIRWYTEHTALVITTLKWALLGVVAGLCVGLGTRAFLWTLAATTATVEGLARSGLRPYDGLPIALPIGVWLIRRFAPTARGHGTEAVIAAVHQDSGSAGQARQHHSHARLRWIGRQGGTLRPDRRGDH